MAKPNLMQLCEKYMGAVLKETPGLKCLVLDKETLAMVSLVYSQSSLLKANVYLTARITESSDSKLPSMKAVYFLRPTEENIQLLCSELQAPRFQEYSLFFTNHVPEKHMRAIAEADSRDLVRCLQEAYLDFYAINRNCFSLNRPSCANLYKGAGQWTATENLDLKRITDSLYGLAVTLRIIPTVRFLRHSEACRRVAEELASRLEVDRTTNISKFNQLEKAILIVTSRAEDLATPLISDWTYQAMLHEMLGLNSNRINLREGVGYSVSEAAG
jgi:vacuolar protein sorting-associated protein 45